MLELGSRKGNCTLAFLAGAEESGGHVWSCDIDDVTADPDGMAPWAGCERWTFIRGDDMHPAVRAKLPAEVDVLFIDTSHEYEHTVRELEAYMPRVAPGGVALFHDTRFTLRLPWRQTGRHPAAGRAGDRRVLRADGEEMDGHPGPVRSGHDPAVNPKLLKLIESGEFDWDDPRHREAYLRAWVNGTAPPPSRAGTAGGSPCLTCSSSSPAADGPRT